MRHSAWLSAVPSYDKKGRLSGDEKKLSRYQKIKDAGDEPDMPPLDCPHIIGYLFDVGPMMTGGMAASPVTYQEIDAWRRQTGIEIEPWEAQFIRRLSSDYVAQLHQSDKPDCPPPYIPPADVVDREAVSSKLKSAMRFFMSSVKRKA